jgi:hypothetical protein
MFIYIGSFLPFAGLSPPALAFSSAFLASPGNAVKITLAVIVIGRSAISLDSGIASAGPPGESGAGEAIASGLGELEMNEVWRARGEEDDGLGELDTPVGFLGGGGVFEDIIMLGYIR